MVQCRAVPIVIVGALIFLQCLVTQCRSEDGVTVTTTENTTDSPTEEPDYVGAAQSTVANSVDDSTLSTKDDSTETPSVTSASASSHEDIPNDGEEIRASLNPSQGDPDPKTESFSREQDTITISQENSKPLDDISDTPAVSDADNSELIPEKSTPGPQETASGSTTQSPDQSAGEIANPNTSSDYLTKFQTVQNAYGQAVDLDDIWGNPEEAPLPDETQNSSQNPADDNGYLSGDIDNDSMPIITHGATIDLLAADLELNQDVYQPNETANWSRDGIKDRDQSTDYTNEPNEPMGNIDGPATTEFATKTNPQDGTLTEETNESSFGYDTLPDKDQPNEGATARMPISPVFDEKTSNNETIPTSTPADYNANHEQVIERQSAEPEINPFPSYSSNDSCAGECRKHPFASTEEGEKPSNESRASESTEPESSDDLGEDYSVELLADDLELSPNDDPNEGAEKELVAKDTKSSNDPSEVVEAEDGEQTPYSFDVPEPEPTIALEKDEPPKSSVGATEEVDIKESAQPPKSPEDANDGTISQGDPLQATQEYEGEGPVEPPPEENKKTTPITEPTVESSGLNYTPGVAQGVVDEKRLKEENAENPELIQNYETKQTNRKFETVLAKNEYIRIEVITLDTEESDVPVLQNAHDMGEKADSISNEGYKEPNKPPIEQSYFAPPADDSAATVQSESTQSQVNPTVVPDYGDTGSKFEPPKDALPKASYDFAEPKPDYVRPTTLRPADEPAIKPRCPFSVKSLMPQVANQETRGNPPPDTRGEAPYYEMNPFCLTRHHVLLPVMPIFVSQWCFSPETPDFLCPLYDLGFHIAFEHDTSPELYYRCMYGRAVLLKCPYLHHWDDERKMCTIVEDFRHIHHYPADQPRRTNLQHGNWQVQQYCRHCQRNFLTPRDLDPEAQCSDRMLLACNTDGSLSVYECPEFHFYGRLVQLRWYAEQERCDYPAHVQGPWQG